MQKRIFAIINKEEGATSVEYALLAFLIAVAIVAAVSTLGLATFNLFDAAANEFSNF